MDKNNPAFYCSVIDAGRTALVLGPFETEAECRTWAYADFTGRHHRLLKEACDRDPKAWFYAWGMVKMPNGHRDGVMNRYLGI